MTADRRWRRALIAAVVWAALGTDVGAQPPAREEAVPDDEAIAAEAEAPVRDGAQTAGAFSGLSFGSGDEPITVEADRLEFDYDKNRLVYRGQVHVVQGDLELRSKHLVVRFERIEGGGESAKLTRVVAQGDVLITQGERRASGDRAVFDQTDRRIVLLGDPVLRDGPNEVQGDRITVFLDEGRSVVESSPKKRVSAVLFPGQSGSGEAPSDPPPEVLPSPTAGGKTTP